MLSVLTQEPELAKQKESSLSKALLGPDTGRVESDLNFTFAKYTISECFSVIRLMITDYRLSVYICMCVCMYICMCVSICMYACMYVYICSLSV